MAENKTLAKGKGIVKTIYHDKGFGFIRQDDGTDIFFHASGVCNPPKFEDLREGMPVNYFLVEYEKKGEKRRKAIGVVTV